MNVKLYARGDLNEHIEVCHSGYKNVHRSFGYETKNAKGESILNFALSCNCWLLIHGLRKEIVTW